MKSANKRGVLFAFGELGGARMGWRDEVERERTAMTLTRVVLPEFWRPTRVSSISCFQNRLLNHSSRPSKKLLNIFASLSMNPFFCSSQWM